MWNSSRRAGPAPGTAGQARIGGGWRWRCCWRGRPDDREPAVDEFLRFATDQSLSLEELWLAEIDGKAVASVLLVTSPGRTALLFLSPLGAAAEAGIVSELIRTACLAQPAGSLHLIQALLDPAQREQRGVLEQSGFSLLARLEYMQRSLDRSTSPDVVWPEGCAVTTWSEPSRERFRRAIEGSYEGTLDCPGLLGLRDMEDVLAGHMATGQFDPAMWFLLEHEGEPAGVILLNEVVQGGAFELVYLGLTPAFRSKGLADRLLEHGLGAAARRGAESVLLAVDEQNEPAMRLYRRAKFQSTGHKVAMIFHQADPTKRTTCE